MKTHFVTHGAVIDMAIEHKYRNTDPKSSNTFATHGDMAIEQTATLLQLTATLLQLTAK